MTPYICIIVCKMQMRCFSSFVFQIWYTVCLQSECISNTLFIVCQFQWLNEQASWTTVCILVRSLYCLQQPFQPLHMYSNHLYTDVLCYIYTCIRLQSSFELYVIRVWCVLLESELYTMKIINKASVCCTGIKHSVLVVRISRAKNVDLNRCALWYVLFQSNCIQTFHSIHECVQIRFFFRTPSLSCNWFLCIYSSHSIYLIN